MPSILLLGADGFIGREVLREAISRGLQVKGLVRNAGAAQRVREAGGEPIEGDVSKPQAWIGHAAGMNALIDLVQPKLPSRVGRSALLRIQRMRVELTGGVLEALRSLPAEQRPVLFNVSGTTDLALDAEGRASHRSGPIARPVGFANIGIPVRRILEASGLGVSFIHLGTVYGEGKTFTERILPGLRRGRFPIIGRGDNRTPWVHVHDVARALVHLAALPREQLVGKTWVVADGANNSLEEFVRGAAKLVGGPRPMHVPRWLASWIVGSGMVEEMCQHSPIDASALLSTGFSFQYPSFREGIPPILAALANRSG